MDAFALQLIHQQTEATSNKAFSLANGFFFLNMKQQIGKKIQIQALKKKHPSFGVETNP